MTGKVTTGPVGRAVRGVTSAGRASVLPYLATEGAGNIIKFGKGVAGDFSGVPTNSDIAKYYGSRMGFDPSKVGIAGQAGLNTVAAIQDLVPFAGGPWEEAERGQGAPVASDKPTDTGGAVPPAPTPVPADISKYYSKDDANMYGGLGAGMGDLSRDRSEIDKMLAQLAEERGQPQKTIKDFVKEIRDLRPDEKTDATHKFLDAISQQEANITANTEEGKRMARAKAFFTVAQKGTPAAGGLLGGIAAGGAEYADAITQLNKDTEAAQQKMMTARYEAVKAAEEENNNDLRTAISEYSAAERDRAANLNAQRQLALGLYQAKGQNDYYKANLGLQAAQLRMAGSNMPDIAAWRKAIEAGDTSAADRIAEILNFTSGYTPAGIAAGAASDRAQLAAQEKIRAALNANPTYQAALRALAANPNDVKAQALKRSIEQSYATSTDNSVNYGPLPLQ